MINRFSPVCRTDSVCKSLSVLKSVLETQRITTVSKMSLYLKRQNRVIMSSFQNKAIACIYRFVGHFLGAAQQALNTMLTYCRLVKLL